MASALVTTPGAADANSYCSLDAARAYYNDHPYRSAAALLTDDQLTQLLITATALIDEHFDWPDGVPTSSEQRLMWPMRGLYSRAGYFGEQWGGLSFRPGALIPDNVIPDFVQHATAEFAAQLALTDRTADNAVSTAGISSVKAGPVAVTFNGTGGRKVVPDAVADKLAPWGRLKSRSSVRLVRC